MVFFGRCAPCFLSIFSRHLSCSLNFIHHSPCSLKFSNKSPCFLNFIHHSPCSLKFSNKSPCFLNFIHHSPCSLKPVLNWANVCSPNILRTVRRTMIRFLIEHLVRRTWFGQSKFYFVLNWLVMRCKLRPELAADAQQTA